MSNKAWIGLAAVAIAAIAVVPWMLQRARRRQIRTELLAELKPVVLKNCDLKRFGSPNDGGYLLCENLSDGIQSAYSYGIGPDDAFGRDVSKRYGVAVHQYDCFDPSRPKYEGARLVFHDECIGPRAERDQDQRVFDTLQNQISRNGDTGKRLIVKIDVEGAEWDSLLATPDAVLEKIDQIPMELHGVNERRYLELVRRLKQKFYLVNLHFNNWWCPRFSRELIGRVVRRFEFQRLWTNFFPGLDPFPAPVFQVLWVNNRIGVIDESAPVPAPFSRLNAPDNPHLPDCQLPSRS